jgi:hypothetical protein
LFTVGPFGGAYRERARRAKTRHDWPGRAPVAIMRRMKTKSRFFADTFVLLVAVFALTSTACGEKKAKTFTLRLIGNRTCPLAVALDVVCANSDLAAQHRLHLPIQITRDFELIQRIVAASEADAALVPAAQAVMLLSANPDWRLRADFGPTRRVLLIALGAAPESPRELINFADEEGLIALEYWRRTQSGVALKNVVAHKPPSNYRPQFLPPGNMLLMTAEPLEETFAARPDLRTVIGLDEHLLLLVNRSYARQHEELVDALLSVLCETPMSALRRNTIFLERIADSLGATVSWTQTQLAGLSLNGSAEAGCRKSVDLSASEKQNLEALVAAGVQAGVIRRAFSLGGAIW